MTYFDHNATTPLDERVLAAMLPFLTTFYGNPSSLYRHGRLARTAIDTAREQLAALIDAPAAQIIFTSGGTEANNLALASLPPHGTLAISAIEHASITEPAQRLHELGTPLDILPVDSNGCINTQNLPKHAPDLVSVMLANNETGAIQDLAPLVAKLTGLGTVIHTDAVQALGKIPLSFRQLGVQLMSLSSHKIYGPKGCGALVYDKDTAITPLLLGGGQEQAQRAGTENVAAIVGFGKAAELAKAEMAERSLHTRQLRDMLEAGLAECPGAVIFAQDAQRLPNTVQFGLPDTDGEMLLMKLDKKAIAISSGSACASGGSLPSPVLLAMGVAADVAKSAIRVSFGAHNTPDQVYDFIKQLQALVYQA